MRKRLRVVRMTKKSDTWMPFYVTDYLGDTMHLSTTQHGAYLLLLLACWKAGGDLPDDDEQLVSITRMTAGDWRKSSAVLRRFFQAGDGVLSHGRVKQELEKAKALSEKRSAIGKAGGRPPKEKQTETNRFPDAEAKPKQNETPSPSPTTYSEAKASGGEPPTDRELLFSNGVPLLTAAGVSEKNARSMLAGLAKAHGDAAVVQALNDCAASRPVEPVSWLQAALRTTPAARQTFAQQAADIARTTVPAKPGRDPTLMQIEADRAKAKPMTAEIRQALAEAAGRMSV